MNPKVKPSSARKRRPAAARNSVKPLSEKLQALQSLIPEQETTSAEINADKLLRETADYILLLETRVSVLQGLIRFYEAAECTTEDCSCS
uniref:BHLH domain-containing protein n=1 Tax=Kalanchoe fedtschenkoi TaxID=63787 RepID=A0A7N1A699_KALFE